MPLLLFLANQSVLHKYVATEAVRTKKKIQRLKTLLFNTHVI